MRWCSMRKFTAVFVMALAVIFANVLLSYSNTMKMMESQLLVTESQQLINVLEGNLLTFQNAKNSQLLYLLTGENAYLQKYDNFQSKITESKRILKEQLSEKSKRQKLFLSIEAKLESSWQQWQTEIALRQKQDLQSVAAYITSRSPKQDDELSQVIHQAVKTEESLLQKRMQRSQTNLDKAIAIFIITALVDLVLVTILYYLLRGYIRRLKQTESALQDSENRLRAMFDAEPECIQLIARDGRLLEINASGLAMLEVKSPEVVIGNPVYAAIAPEYREDFSLLHEKVCQGKRGTLEFEILGFRGGKRWVETHAVPLVNEADGSFLHLAVTRDISKRKQAEQKIQEQAALLDVATDAIMVQDIHKQILYWNKGAENLYGWRGEEVLGKNAFQLLYQEISPQLEDALFTVVQQGAWQGELHQVTDTGKNIIVESRWTLVRDEGGKTKSILIVNTEITQKKQLEAQLLRSQRLESIGTLAGGIAHDLNNVLAPILLAVQLLEMKSQDAQQQRILRTLENNVKRGANLIRQVLSFARGIESKQTVIDIRQLIGEIEQIIHQTFPKCITWETDIPTNLWNVRGDTTQLHQVLMNLVVNARDAMAEGGRIDITAHNFVIDRHYAQMHLDAKEGAYVVITVADTGMGIPPNIQERIFEPFFTTKEVGKGTGLGLSTALGIIKNHQGFVNVYSEVARGTKFQVYLPAFHQCPVPIHPREGEMFTGNGQLILIVDDEAAIREITKSTLESHNYRAITANDAVEALAIYADRQQEITAIVLDMMTPGIDGAIAIRTLQKINPNVKIIAVSGLLSPEKITHSPDINIQGFIAKPFTTQELLQTLHSILPD
ncbi:histidine kinase [Calothrix sp. 336/3]|nr:histidine kinase [Calothrix sp. 336/3]